MRIYKLAALVIGTAIVLAAIVPALATSAAQKFQEVIVRNTSSEPVPVTSPPPPLWQGTPYVRSKVILGSGCEDLPAIPADRVLFAERLIVNFNVAPGQDGAAFFGFTPLGATPDGIDIPAHPSAPAVQVVGNYDRYQGAVDLGLPLVGTPRFCLFASSDSDTAGRLTLMGSLVPAS